ncbi:hypothetical protein ARMGADRAFT_1093595 [Armillaria gallica]|uniref:Uncharacterized protein n=1 Tax=Armillaria gallica TaxID=47427 RepID=A0A2H3CUI6_ARMGA|nr:hypothetical protein ARMGADRAFT_1093595 [Armillaria gallica]
MLQSLQWICIPRRPGLYVTVIPEEDGRAVYVFLLELVAGKNVPYLCGDGDGEDILADYLCEKHRDAIFVTLFRLAMDFYQPQCSKVYRRQNKAEERERLNERETPAIRPLKRKVRQSRLLSDH